MSLAPLSCIAWREPHLLKEASREATYGAPQWHVIEGVGGTQSPTAATLPTHSHLLHLSARSKSRQCRAWFIDAGLACMRGARNQTGALADPERGWECGVPVFLGWRRQKHHGRLDRGRAWRRGESAHGRCRIIGMTDDRRVERCSGRGRSITGSHCCHLWGKTRRTRSERRRRRHRGKVTGRRMRWEAASDDTPVQRRCKTATLCIATVMGFTWMLAAVRCPPREFQPAFPTSRLWAMCIALSEAKRSLMTCWSTPCIGEVYTLRPLVLSASFTTREELLSKMRA